MPIVIRTGGGGAGGGDQTYTDTYANIPAASQDGHLFFPTDACCIYRDTGAAWEPWGPVFHVTEPPAAGWSWDNQGAAAVSSTKGGVELYGPSHGANNQLHFYKRAIPAVPYTVTMMIIGNPRAPSTGGGWQAVWGIGWRESASGKCIAVQNWASQAQNYIDIVKWNNSATYTAQYGATQTYAPLSTGALPPYWRLEDDNTDRIVSFSNDGFHFQEYHSIGRADFMTADEIGICINPYQYASAVILLSWEEA